MHFFHFHFHLLMSDAWQESYFWALSPPCSFHMGDILSALVPIFHERVIVCIWNYVCVFVHIHTFKYVGYSQCKNENCS